MCSLRMLVAAAAGLTTMVAALVVVSGSGDVPRGTNLRPPPLQSRGSGGGGRTVSYADVAYYCSPAYRKRVAKMIRDHESEIRAAVSQSLSSISVWYFFLFVVES